MASVLSPSPTLAPPSRFAITTGAVAVALVAAAWRVLTFSGFNNDLFVLANRGFARGQMAFRPSFYTSREDQERALARLRAQSVPFVIVSLEEESGFRGAMPRIATYVDDHYERLALIRVPDTRGLQLYVERGRRRAGIDRETGWPCFVDH